MIDEVWNNTIVCDEPVYQAVAVLRRALSDDSHRPSFIETVAKKGYRFIVEVTPVDESDTGAV